MTPADHGYVKCARCGTWRPRKAIDLEDLVGIGGKLVRQPVCLDRAWCSQQAAVGKGEMDVGAP